MGSLCTLWGPCVHYGVPVYTMGSLCTLWGPRVHYGVPVYNMDPCVHYGSLCTLWGRCVHYGVPVYIMGSLCTVLGMHVHLCSLFQSFNQQPLYVRTYAYLYTSILCVQFKDFFKFLAEKSGLNEVNMSNVWIIADTAYVQHVHNKSLSWVNSSVLNNLTMLSGFDFKFMFDSKSKSRLGCGQYHTVVFKCCCCCCCCFHVMFWSVVSTILLSLSVIIVVVFMQCFALRPVTYCCI